MKLRTLASVAVALSLTGGCNSLNTAVYINAPMYTELLPPQGAVNPAMPAASTPLVTAPLMEPKRVDGTVQLCPVFKVPLLPKMPELPFKEITAVGPGNPAKIEEIERHHIEELRLYITTMHGLLLKARSQYQLECKPYLKR